MLGGEEEGRERRRWGWERGRGGAGERVAFISSQVQGFVILFAPSRTGVDVSNNGLHNFPEGIFEKKKRICIYASTYGSIYACIHICWHICVHASLIRKHNMLDNMQRVSAMLADEGGDQRTEQGASTMLADKGGGQRTWW